MSRPVRDDVQARRDIRQARALLGRLRGFSPEESGVALREHAALTGVSLHAAALAVLAPRIPVQEPPGRDPVLGRAGRIVLSWQGARKACLQISGPCDADLAVRLRRAVERSTRAGATELVIDVRGAVGGTTELEAVLVWACRRLWARQGSLRVRSPEAD